MTASVPKSEVVDALRAHFEALLDDLARSQKDATASMRVDGDHRPANRGERGAVTSAGYLTQGLEQRMAELRDALDLLDRAGAGPRAKAVTGALVEVELDSGDTRAYYVFPGGSGVALGAVTVISPDSPVGRALWGREEDDEVELPVGEGCIVSVA